MADPAVTVPVHLTAELFRDFYWFDVVRRKRTWLRPALFALILCAAAVLCFVLRARQRGAAVLGVVLVVVGLGLPLAFFSSIARFVARQSKLLGLSVPRQIATVVLSDEGMRVEGGKEPLRYGWDDIYAVYQAPRALYLYVGENQAHLLPHGDMADPQAVLELLRAHLPAEKLHKIH